MHVTKEYQQLKLVISQTLMFYNFVSGTYNYISILRNYVSTAFAGHCTLITTQKQLFFSNRTVVTVWPFEYFCYLNIPLFVLTF